MKIIALLAITIITACGAQAAAAKAAEGAYTLELVQCEQEAGTRAAGATCRCGVDVKFGVDGGNCK